MSQNWVADAWYPIRIHRSEHQDGDLLEGLNGYYSQAMAYRLRGGAS
jgi:hypothetical protein